MSERIGGALVALFLVAILVAIGVSAALAIPYCGRGTHVQCTAGQEVTLLSCVVVLMGLGVAGAILLAVAYQVLRGRE